MKIIAAIILSFLLFSFDEKEPAVIQYRSFYAEMKALEKPERVNAFSRIQGASNSGTSTNSVSVTVSATSTSNLLVVTVWVVATNSITGISDNGSNTYGTAQNFVTAGSYRFAQYYAFQSSSTTSVTVTTSGSTDFVVTAEEFSGFTGTPTNAECYDVSNYKTDLLIPMQSNSISPINTSCLIYASSYTDNTSQIIGAGFTAGQNGTIYSGDYVKNKYKLTSGTSENAPFTGVVDGVSWGVIVTSFKQEDAVGSFKSKVIRSSSFKP